MATSRLFNSRKEANITKMANELSWLVVPLLNPDGYEYTRSSTNPNIRLWRKNRAPNQCVGDRSDNCCKGVGSNSSRRHAPDAQLPVKVDLNRNFDFHFNESGSSDDPCSEIFQGPEA